MSLTSKLGIFSRVLQLKTAFQSTKRTFHRDLMKFSRSQFSFSKKSLFERFRLSDKVKDGFEIVYRAPMASYILALSIGSATTVTLMSTAGIYAMSQNLSFEDLAQNKTYGDKTIITTDQNELIGFVISFIGFNWTIFLMIRRYPLRIYRCADKYVAIFEGHIPFLRRHITFSKGQVEPLPAKGIMPWKESRFSINGSRSILLEQYFKTPSELHRMIHEKYKYY